MTLLLSKALYHNCSVVWKSCTAGDSVQQPVCTLNVKGSFDKSRDYPSLNRAHTCSRSLEKNCNATTNLTKWVCTISSFSQFTLLVNIVNNVHYSLVKIHQDRSNMINDKVLWQIQRKINQILLAWDISIWPVRVNKISDRDRNISSE